MNKNRFRLVYDHGRGMLVPVAEVSGSRGKVAGSGEGTGPAGGMRIRLTLLTAAIGLSPGWALAGVVVDGSAPVSQQAEVSDASNGTPVINIAAANAKGLSHNTFTQFDVDARGLIYNNSQSDGVSQLGGGLMKNPNLAGSTSAKAILTEVNGGNPSTLGGALEVFGPTADVLIANENGVMVNGLSTVNVQGLLLTTGKTQRNADGTVSFVVSQGGIGVNGSGVNTDGLSYFDLVARSAYLNGVVAGTGAGTQVRVIAGLNQYDASTRGFFLRQYSATGAPQYGIEGSALGAMYGANVSLVSTEAGVGVRHAGVVTSAQDLTVSANGDVQVGQWDAGRAVSVQGQDVAVSQAGAITAGEAVSVTAQSLSNEGVIVSRAGAVGLQVATALHNQGTVSAAGALRVSGAGEVWNEGLAGVMRGAQGVAITVGGDVSNLAGGLITAAQGPLTLHGRSVFNEGSGSVFQSSSDVTVTATSGVFNRSGAVVNAGGGLAVHAGGVVLNDGAGSQLHGHTVSVTSGTTLTNQVGAQITALDQVVLQGHAVLNQAADVVGKRVDIGATDVSNQAGGRIQATQGLVVNAQGAVTNTGVDTLMLGQTVQVTAGSVLSNSDGAQVYGSDRVILQGSRVSNRAARVSAENVDIVANGDVVNGGGGEIQAGNALTVHGGTVTNEGAEALLQGRTIALSAGAALNNRAGAVVQAADTLTVDAQTVTNDAARLQAGWVGADGVVHAGDATVRAVGAVRNTQGATVLATGGVTLAAGSTLVNDAAAKILGASVGVTAGSSVSNTNAQIRANESLTVTAATIDNNGNNGNTATGIDAEQVTLTAHERLSNAGQILAYDRLAIAATNFSNAASGQILAQNALNLTTDTYGNTGTLLSNGDATLTLGHSRDLVLTATSLAPIAHGLLTLNANNVSVQVQTDNPGSIQINAAGGVNNTQSLISGADLAIQAGGAVDNQAGALLWAARDLTVHSSTLTNRTGAQIAAQRDLTLEAGAAINEGGARLSAGRDLSVDATTLLNDATLGGSVVDGPAEAAGSSYDDYHDARHEHYTLSLNGLAAPTSALTLTPGVIEAGGNVRLNQGAKLGSGATVTNRNGQIVAGGNLLVDGNVDNVALGQNEPLMDYLQRPVSIVLDVQPSSNIGTPLWDGTRATYGSLLELLTFIFDDANQSHPIGGAYYWYNDKALKTLMQSDASPMLNKVMNQLLGPDWKTQDYATLVGRWDAFVTTPNAAPALEFYPNTQTELAAAGSFVHSGGHFVNGANQAPQQPAVTVQVGTHTVDTTLGQFDAQVNLGELTQTLDPLTALSDLLGNTHLYRRNPTLPAVGGGSAPLPQTYPLFETSNKYIDQSQFYGSDYFLRKVGYALDPTVTVLADNYMTHQMLDKMVTRAVGGWFAKTLGIVGPGLVQWLMAQAFDVMTPLGLTVGVAPTAEQLAKADTDFIWYVHEQIDGKPVLVPKVYLSQATLTAYRNGGAPDGARAAAGVGAHGSVWIAANQGGVVNVNGQISGRRGVSITSQGAILNAGTAGLNGGIDSGGGKVVLDAKGDIRNQGAQIQGTHVGITTAGKFTDVVGMGFDSAGYQAVRNNAAITATDPKGLVTVKAGADIDLTAAVIGGHDVRLESGGTVSTHDMHVVDSSFSSETKEVIAGYSHTEQTHANATAVGTQLQAGAEGGQLVIKAGQGVELNGGSYSADRGSISTETGDVVTKPSQDYAYSKATTQIEQFVAGAEGGMAGAGGDIGYGTITGTKGQEYVNGEYVNSKAAGGKLNEGKAVQGQLAGANLGYEKTEDTQTQQTVKNRNLALTFGQGLSVEAKQGTVDIGGADMNADDDGTIAVTGQQIVSTKFEDEDTTTNEHHRTFFGINTEAHSAIADTINHSTELAEKAGKEGMSVDAGMTTLQAVGDATNLIFGDTVGGSTNLQIQREDTHSRTTTRTENLNTVRGGTISLQSTGGDIDLTGVDLLGSKQVTLDSADQIKLSAATSHTDSSSDYLMNQVTTGVNYGTNAVFAQASVGLSAGYNAATDKTRETSSTHTNSHVSAQQVTLKSKGDTTLAGANIDADRVNAQVGGDLNVMSVQDTRSMTHEKSDWGMSVGASVAATGQQGPVPVRATINVSAQAGYGKDTDESRLTVERSGIHARKSLTAQVSGDLNLKGASLGSDTGEGAVHVAGTATVQALEDVHEKDGGYASAGGGLGKNGLPTVNLGAERVDQVHYRADQRSAVAVKDFSSAGGVQGELKRELTGLTQVTLDQKVAGNTAALTLDMDAVKDEVDARKPSTQAHGPRHDAPRVGAAPSSKPDTPLPRSLAVKPSEPGKMPRASSTRPNAVDTKYDSRVIVQLESDATTDQAAQRIYEKHPDNSVLIQRDAQGRQRVVAGNPEFIGGKTKIELVGHGRGEEGGTRALGGLSPEGIAQEVVNLRDGATGRGGSLEVTKVTAVGCDTGACRQGPSLATQVEQALQTKGVQAPIKGYDGRIDLTADGHKRSVEEGGLGGALGKLIGRGEERNSPAEEVNPIKEAVPRAKQNFEASEKALNAAQSSLAERKTALGLYQNGRGDWLIRQPPLGASQDVFSTFLRNQREFGLLTRDIKDLSAQTQHYKAELEIASNAQTRASVDHALKTVPFSSDERALRQQIARERIPVKDVDLFESVPDGLVTAKIMADHNIAPDFHAVRTQNRRHINFEGGTTAGHQNAVASIENWYSGGSRNKAEVRASDLATRTNQDMLNVDITPESKIADTVHGLKRYAKDTSEFISFPLRTALEHGARMYPDKGASYPGSNAFVIGLPRGTALPVSVLNRESVEPGQAAREIESTDAWVKLGQQAGSNRGGVYRDSHGKEWAD